MRQPEPRVCPHCGLTKTDADFGRQPRLPVRGACRRCVADYNAAWARAHPAVIRLRNQEYSARHPEKRRAQKAVSKAIERGRMERRPCVVCGAAKAEAHHHSYAEADRLNITWLCSLHHKEVHRNPLHPLNPVRKETTT